MPEMQTRPLEAAKIDDSSYRIEDNGVRSLLFIGTDRALLVDTGFGNAGSLRDVVEALTDKPVTLVNTHADDDHTGKNEEFDCAYMHPAEMPYYFATAKPGAKAAPLWEGDIIDLGGRKFEVVLIPGHTPGSIGLLDRENRILVAGDSISYTPVFMFTEVRSIYAHMASMEKLLKMKGSFDVIYSAHGDMEVSPAQISKLLEAGKKLVAGDITPMEPPFPIPAKMYVHNGAAFFY